MILPTAVAGLIAACTDSSEPAAGGTPDGGGSTITPAPTGTGTDADPPPVTTPQGKAGTGEATGLPCDVQAVIENRCIACHGAASPPPLLNYNDLTAKSTRDPAKTRAALAVELMKGKSMPPLPAPPPEAAEIASFEEWVAAGTPKNPVGCTDPDPDAGVPDAAAPPIRGDGGVQCTSGKMYVPADGRNERMEPGGACLNCHQQQGGPNLTIAGTVYPTLHEPDRCLGSAPPPELTVTVTDSDKPRAKQITMKVNEAGNFFSVQPYRAPIVRAVVRDEVTKKERVMVNRINRGDCNACHTQQGQNRAPGRIMAP
jgi:mono/diheme cytochrome c family protein